VADFRQPVDVDFVIELHAKKGWANVQFVSFVRRGIATSVRRTTDDHEAKRFTQPMAEEVAKKICGLGYFCRIYGCR
jgi:hypothetical protein